MVPGLLLDLEIIYHYGFKTALLHTLQLTLPPCPPLIPRQSLSQFEVKYHHLLAKTVMNQVRSFLLKGTSSSQTLRFNLRHSVLVVWKYVVKKVEAFATEDEQDRIHFIFVLGNLRHNAKFWPRLPLLQNKKQI